MIVQALDDHVYWMDEQHVPTLIRRSEQLLEAAHLDDALLFSTLLQKLVQFIQTEGQPVAPEEFTPPDFQIPTPETPLREASLDLEQALSSLKKEG
jgi:hypothetical protein